VNSDIEALLQKCVDDPANRKRYADLVLNLDPSNKEALEFLKDAQPEKKKKGFGLGAARVVAAGYTLGLSEVGLRAHKKFKDNK
jgi:ribosomal protein S18 acetylase RimI-like enzyme